MPLKDHFRRSIPAPPKKRDSHESARNADSSSVAAHASTGSVDVGPPKTAASASSGAANSVKLVSGSHEDHAQNGAQLPMPNAISSMTISNFLPTRDSSLNAQIQGYQGYQNSDDLTGGPMQRTDHNDLSLSANGNHTQKSYNMAQASSTSALPSSPPTNGAYSDSNRLTLPNNRGGPAPISTVRALSGQFGGARSHSNLRDQSNMNSDGASSSKDEWSSAVGGATMSGKSGRMIEKLMSERDTMRRQMAVLEEEKMEMVRERAMHAEMQEQKQARFEQELHEASTNSILLKKRDRQVMDLKEKVDIERARADSFQENERVWKRQLEKLAEETTHKVAKAEHELRQAEASLKIYQDTWSEKRAMIEKTRVKLTTDVKQHLKTVVAHADALAQRDQIYAQSSEKFNELVGVNKKQKKVFEDFKIKIDEDLGEIKTKAKEREVEADEMKSKVKETCDKMGWVLNVKKNVRGAQ